MLCKGATEHTFTYLASGRVETGEGHEGTNANHEARTEYKRVVVLGSDNNGESANNHQREQQQAAENGALRHCVTSTELGYERQLLGRQARKPPPAKAQPAAKPMG